MDNKRKIVGTVLGKGPVKLRKVSLNAFETSEQSQEAQLTEKSTDNSGTTAPKSDDPYSDIVDPAQQEIVLKTALWISNNADKVAALMDKSKENPMLAFVADSHGATAAGRMYLRELQRLKTEKEVQAVCSGIQDAPVVHASQIASFIEQSRLAAVAASANFNVNTSDSFTHAPTAAPASAASKERRNRWGPSLNEASQAPTSATATHNHTSHAVPSSTAASRFGAIPSHAPTSTSSEAAQIARLAASFDHTSPDPKDSARLAKHLKEQREMQLIESRIRDAASQGLSGSGDNKSIIEVAKFLAQHADSSSTGGASNSTSLLHAHKGPALLMAEKQAALYLERLAQYTELAALHDADTNYRDTTEEAERSGGVIEGGTWEHRKRAKEMLFTASKNLELTLLGSGKTHMADYLPKDVLDAFLKNAESVSKGGGVSGTSTDVHTINSSNVGYQLLKKSGWSEGSGLGASGGGIVQPITATSSSSAGTHNPYTSSSSTAPLVVSGVTIAGGRGPEGAGLGVSATHEVTEGDTDIEQYRKRMMLAYRFRPNPLNNPRRNYY